MSEHNKADFNYHPIQLREIKVLKLSIEDNPAFDGDFAKEDFSDFGFYHMHSDYDAESQTFFVKVKAVIGQVEDGCEQGPDEELTVAPFNMVVELAGLFSVDESSFKTEYIDSFARRNAPLLVYPYLREHVYSLTNRAGYDPALLPLFEVPAFKLQK